MWTKSRQSHVWWSVYASSFNLQRQESQAVGCRRIYTYTWPAYQYILYCVVHATYIYYRYCDTVFAIQLLGLIANSGPVFSGIKYINYWTTLYNYIELVCRNFFNECKFICSYQCHSYTIGRPSLAMTFTTYSTQCWFHNTHEHTMLISPHVQHPHETLIFQCCQCNISITLQIIDCYYSRHASEHFYCGREWFTTSSTKSGVSLHIISCAHELVCVLHGTCLHIKNKKNNNSRQLIVWRFRNQEYDTERCVIGETIDIYTVISISMSETLQKWSKIIGLSCLLERWITKRKFVIGGSCSSFF